MDVPQIGDVDEGIVERGEDAGNAENELACLRDVSGQPIMTTTVERQKLSNAPSPARGPRETFSLAGAGVFLGGIATVSVGGLVDGIWKKKKRKKRRSDSQD